MGRHGSAPVATDRAAIVRAHLHGRVHEALVLSLRHSRRLVDADLAAERMSRRSASPRRRTHRSWRRRSRRTTPRTRTRASSGRRPARGGSPCPRWRRRASPVRRQCARPRGAHKGAPAPAGPTRRKRTRRRKPTILGRSAQPGARSAAGRASRWRALAAEARAARRRRRRATRRRFGIRRRGGELVLDGLQLAMQGGLVDLDGSAARTPCCGALGRKTSADPSGNMAMMSSLQGMPNNLHWR